MANDVSVKKALKDGKLLILAPKTIMGMKTLTKDMDKLQRLYWDGFRQAKKIEEFIKE